MRLIDDWHLVLRRAWSIRLILLAALLSGLEVALPILDGFINFPRGWFAAASGFFSTVEKHYNFAFENGGTGLVMPTTPVYTSSLSGQTNESVTLGLSSIAGAHGADAYIEFAATIGAGGRTNPIVSLDEAKGHGTTPGR